MIAAAESVPVQLRKSWAKSKHFSPSTCGGLNDCITMGSIVSTAQKHNHQRHQSVSQMEQQVADLERELHKQKELRVAFRTRMERTQDYLKYCLQTAQDNGLLDIITGNKDHHQEEALLPSNMIGTNTTPKSPDTMQKDSDLAGIVHQAKMNGWYIDPVEIELHEKIGQGSTAEIYKATWRGLDVAVKCISSDYFRSIEGGVAYFIQEVETLSRQRHKFVLQLMGACLEPPNFAWLVTEFLGTTLKHWLHGSGKRRKERLVPVPPLKDRIARALEIAQAMQYLHEQKPKVIHRDLKPSNIFLDDANHAIVADFGHARFLSDEEKALTGETGTYVYMAPEVIRCEPYNEKCDVYSFGVILNELITGDHPYIATDSGPSKIAMEVAEGNVRPALPEDDGHQLGELINLICLSWNQDASLRPSFARITSSLRDIQRMFIYSF
ncbi:hypothetical protein K2173_015708 [Erythroxylum novogranatense]|uniref:Protein kinase domain-containing protein n=1 Tax=Erythroxylum novogranatense TaxID=1862640 RepID=A0AAV8SEH6_9ROSI|nr:hypothetical protein K2173_015708 [Erythroxylum novogranatense]